MCHFWVFGFVPKGRCWRQEKGPSCTHQTPWSLYSSQPGTSNKNHRQAQKLLNVLTACRFCFPLISQLPELFFATGKKLANKTDKKAIWLLSQQNESRLFYPWVRAAAR